MAVEGTRVEGKMRGPHKFFWLPSRSRNCRPCAICVVPDVIRDRSLSLGSAPSISRAARTTVPDHVRNDACRLRKLSMPHSTEERFHAEARRRGDEKGRGSRKGAKAQWASACGEAEVHADAGTDRHIACGATRSLRAFAPLREKSFSASPRLRVKPLLCVENVSPGKRAEGEFSAAQHLSGAPRA